MKIIWSGVWRTGPTFYLCLQLSKSSPSSSSFKYNRLKLMHLKQMFYVKLTIKFELFFFTDLSVCIWIIFCPPPPLPICWLVYMIMSRKWNIFRVTGPLWRESAVIGRFRWCGAFMFPLMFPWTNVWANSRNAGDLGSHCTHCDVAAMR